jgi:beta-carotene ketolase (CrtW type)
MMQYIKWYQLLAASITYNLLKPYFPAENLIFFWMLPSFLSTLQLFVFGTYLPHRGDHHHTTQSRSQNKNHLLAFFSCYFFGYHHEHHAFPYLPWWMLPQAKEIVISKTQSS